MAKILIVDDDVDVLRLLMMYVKKGGHHPYTATGVADAKAVLEEREVNLVLCDLRMPDQDGTHLVSYVRSECPNTSILIVSGVNDPSEMETTRSLGADGYVLKPVQRDQLLMEVNSTLGRAG